MESNVILLLSSIGLLIYAYLNIIIWRISSKLGHKYPWLAFIPLVNLFFFLHVGGNNWIISSFINTVFLFFIAFSNERVLYLVLYIFVLIIYFIISLNHITKKIGHSVFILRVIIGGGIFFAIFTVLEGFAGAFGAMAGPSDPGLTSGMILMILDLFFLLCYMGLIAFTDPKKV